MFFSHTYFEFEMISNIIKKFPELIRRTRIHITELLNIENNIFETADLYQKCDIFVSNRFHSVILSIILKNPTIFLCDKVSLKINDLSSKMGLRDYRIDHTDIISLKELLKKSELNKKTIRKKYDQILHLMNERNNLFLCKIKNLLSKSNESN